MPTAGDQGTVRFTVEPHDGTTAAALAVTGPDGTVTSPETQSGDGGATWTAAVTYTSAGVWRLTWTVSGTGTTVDHEFVSVAPVPGATPSGRVYANTEQLAEFLGAAPPLDGARLLLRASELLDADFLLAAVYEVDAAGMPSDPEVAAAFANAVCAQAEFWGEAGEETDITGPLTSASIGSVSLTYGGTDGTSGSGYYAPKLVRALVALPHEKFRMRLGLVW